MGRGIDMRKRVGLRKSHKRGHLQKEVQLGISKGLKRRVLSLAGAEEGKHRVCQGVGSPLASRHSGEMSNTISSTPRALHTYIPTRIQP